MAPVGPVLTTGIPVASFSMVSLFGISFVGNVSLSLTQLLLHKLSWKHLLAANPEVQMDLSYGHVTSISSQQLPFQSPSRVPSRCTH